MAHFLRAIIASKSDIEHCEYPGLATTVDLPQSYCMLPLTVKVLLSIYEQSDSNSYISGFLYLKSSVLDWLAQYFLSGTFALVENDTFGGVGEQSSLVWKDGKCIFGPIHTETDTSKPYTNENISLDDAAINQALRLIGVIKGTEDEFDALDLGKYRNPEDWVLRDA